MSVEEQEQRLRQIQRQYVGFFDDGEADGVYEKAVTELIAQKEKRLNVNINDLRKALPERAQNILDDAFDEIVAIQRALKEYVGTIDPSYAKETKDFFIGFEGSFGSRHLTSRTLTSRYINNLVCVEGIVTKVSLVRPKVVTSVHYCPNTAKSTERHYSDLTSLEGPPTSAAYPTQDDDGNPLQTEFGLSRYKDHQTLSIQELPEKAPTGQLPRSADVIVEHDLVDKVKPGDRVQIVASFRALPGKQGGYTSGTFRTVLLANNIILRGGAEEGPQISGDDVAKCKKLAKQEKKRIFNILSRSLAPSIHGHEYVKRALLCQLLGGVEKILPNGSRLRGDINVMLIGDPSVAKSQMLRYVLATSTRAVTTTGRGTSGVGLTAAVTTDQETGDRRLEAGAMVLADRGIVCIDEFDKMTDMDRTAIHEVMEQGRVTISKAGIHARLNARCSVLAAANPVYGRYDPFKTPMQNIGMQDSLLSRFDLVFILLDTVDLESDRLISDHVVRVHRYRSPREVDGDVTKINSGADDLSTESKDTEVKETPMWAKHDNLLNGGQKAKRGNERLLHLDFVKKYIEVAKCIKPVLTEEACEMIGEEYSRLRSQDFESGGDSVSRTQPVTARALETLIRLSTAHAKARLSKLIEKEDAKTAIELVQFAYFKKVEKKKKKRSHDEDGDDSDSDEEEDADEPAEQTTQDQEQQDDEENVAKPPEAKKARRDPPAPAPASEEVSDTEFDSFKTVLFGAFEASHAQQLPMEDVKKAVFDKTSLNEGQLMKCIEKMTELNKVMLSSDVLYLI